MRTIYVIIGQAGIYSDRHEWPAMATTDRSEAMVWTLRLTEDGERARREFDAMEDELEAEANYWIDPDEPSEWPPRLTTFVATLLDKQDPLNRVLYYRSEPLLYRIEECLLVD